jgi:beta-phosphoglucomutase-like phosphatase (HAD superfamily)
MMGLTVSPGVKALIFDLDGTLSDSLPIHLATWKKLGSSFGFVFDEQLVYEMTGMPTIAFARKIVEDNHLHVAPGELVKMKHNAFRESVHLIKSFDPVVDIVKKYQGKLPMSVGTGASRESAMLQLNQLGLTPYFNYIVTADDVTRHKPESETFLKCAALMGVAPAYCHVFEDGILGMKAARTAGMMVTDVRPYINYGTWTLS